MKHIGSSPPRVDGMDKAAGRIRYTDDRKIPGLHHGATLRSPHPHARIRQLRWDPRKAPKGAVCVLAKDIPGVNGIQILDDRWPVLADEFVNHVGEPVALVAAPTKEAAQQALEAIEVEYEILPAILGWESSEKEAPLHTIDLVEGDVEKALAESEVVVGGEYFTGHQEHAYIETQAMIAGWDDEEGVDVEGSLQCPYYIHGALMHALDLPAEKVRVKLAPTGGAFGGKEDFPSLLATHACLLARACGHPVKMVYGRQEDILCTTKRHPSRVKIRTASDKEGRLQALDILFDLDGGAYLTLSPVVLSRGVLHATGPYNCPNVRIRGRVLKSHTTPSGAFRGFGAPQSIFAGERQMDKLARKLGIDPLTLREINVHRPGDRMATGQVLDESTSAHPCLTRAEELTDFRRRWKQLEEANAKAGEGEPLKGLGLSLYMHGAGFTGLGEKRMRSPVTVCLEAEGRLELRCAAAEMGQGCNTVLPMVAAEAAGLKLEDVRMSAIDTHIVPDSGPTVASRTTLIVGGTFAKAARQLADRLLDWKARKLGLDASLKMDDSRIIFMNGQEISWRELACEYLAEHGKLELTLRNEPPAWQDFDEESYHGSAYPTYAYGCNVIEVEVDPDILQTTPVKITSVIEVGRVLHQALCRGQVEGGLLQSIGYALTEEMKMKDGHHLNDRMATYILPTFMDSPDMDVHFLEMPWAGDPFGAKGVGELPMNGGAPALCQAVENATGIAADTIPATPERLFESHQAGRFVRGDAHVR